MQCLAVVLVVWWLLTLGYFFSCFSSPSCCCCGWWHFGKGYSGIEARSGFGNTTLQPHGTVSYGLGHWDSNCLYTHQDKEIMHRISVANVPAHLLGSAMHALKFVAEPGKRFPHHVVDNKVNTSLERYCNHKRSPRMLSAWHGLPPFQPHQLLLFTTSSHPEGPERSARKHRPWTSNLQWYQEIPLACKPYFNFPPKTCWVALDPSNTITFILLDHGNFSGSDRVWLKTNSCDLS